MKQSRLRDLKRNNVICTMVVFVFSAMIATSLHAMEPTNQLIPRIPMDVIHYSILPTLPEEIVMQETISVKNARCDLGKLRLVNKQFNTFIKTTLEDPVFTSFFINTLEKKFLNGNKVTIAAHLGTLSSMVWMKKFLNEDSSHPLLSSRGALHLNKITDDTHYMLNAHKLLFHVSHACFRRYLELKNIVNPSVVNRDWDSVSLERLSNNKLTYTILYLFLQSGFGSLTILNNRSFAQCCILNDRTDLLPLAHNLKTINHVDNDKNTELMYAVQAAFKKDVELKNIFNFIDFSLRSKPDLELKNKDNKTVFDIAIKMGEDNPRIAKLIMRKLVHAKTINWVHDEAKQT